MNLIALLSLIIFTGVAGGIIAKKLHTPAILGYILAGALLSLFSSFSQEETSAINSLAEIGVALLLFSLGIEFSLSKLLAVKKYAILGGLMQIVLTTLLGRIVFPLLGFSSYEALFLGAVFSLSSTAVVVKIFEEIGQLETRASEITIGWLILQDIAVVLIIIMLENLAGGKINTGMLLESGSKSIILILLALFLGRRIIPNILLTLIEHGTKELLILAAFGFCLLFAFISETLGISFTLGAFLAGIMISESFLHYEVFSEMKPLKTIFSLLFFLSIGSLFSFNYLMANILKIFILVALVTIGKFIIVFAINIFLKMHIRNAVEIALALAQIGEFAFLSSRIGLQNNWITPDLNSLITAVTIISLLISPLIILNTDRIYESLRNFVKNKNQRLYRKIFTRITEEENAVSELHNHVIVCGFGRVGKYIALALQKIKVKSIVIEFNSELVKEAQSRGINVIYGDATSEEILLQAGIDKAKVMVIALPDETEVSEVILQARTLNDTIGLIIRRQNNHSKTSGEEKAIYSVVEPEFEASLIMMDKILHFLGKRDKKVLNWIREIKNLIE